MKHIGNGVPLNWNEIERICIIIYSHIHGLVIIFFSIIQSDLYMFVYKGKWPIAFPSPAPEYDVLLQLRRLRCMRGNLPERRVRLRAMHMLPSMCCLQRKCVIIILRCDIRVMIFYFQMLLSNVYATFYSRVTTVLILVNIYFSHNFFWRKVF